MKNKNKTKIISFCGKGGVGKTSICALTTKILSKNHKILAIDADPAVGLATALNFSVSKTLDDIRNDLIENLKKGNKQSKEQLILNLEYELFSALEENDNIAFLAIGRPETDGCYCQINNFLKDIIKDISHNFDYVLIDCEAGIEQVNRRVIENITHLMLISDSSIKGLNVAVQILNIVRKKINYEKSGLIVNRVKNENELNIFKNNKNFSSIFHVFEDELIYNYDRTGKSLLESDNNFRALNDIMFALKKIFNFT